MAAGMTEGTTLVLALSPAEARAVLSALADRRERHAQGDLDFIEGRRRGQEAAALKRVWDAIPQGVFPS